MKKKAIIIPIIIIVVVILVILTIAAKRKSTAIEVQPVAISEHQEEPSEVVVEDDLQDELEDISSAFEETNEGEKDEDMFYITEIGDDLFEYMKGKSFRDDCTLPREDLRYIHILHKDLDGNVHEGEMVLNKYIAEDVLEIFKELYAAGYPIEKVKLVDDYDADDETSMRDNNSSAFNFRFISHTTRVSKHGLGLAVDINTLYNPYVKTVDGETIIEPATGEPYVDRSKDFDYKIDKNDLCYKLFLEHGFIWGGDWNNRKDYQHFEIPDEVIQELYPGN